ncbi:hypothetical protein FGO68_gene11487 [Halteria grandinella]|uniref:RNase III domain-containing protein n=1 Tax=Halteria grandinella TaxID=5974 RepID=A0A8J8T9S4_HALGN|nr:hypothetical protein FGO68_gene11487 [Halteria grandinella]
MLATQQIQKRINDFQHHQFTLGSNLIIPTKFLRGIEGIITELLKSLKQLDERILILANNNKRAEQILQNIESQCKGRFISKHLSSKKKSQGSKEYNMQTEIGKQIFITLTKRFSTLLLHHDFQLSDFKVIIIDEANQISDSHPLNNIMSNYYFNSKSQKLPVIVGCFPIESLFEKVTNEENIEKQLQTIANILNAKIMMMSYEQVQKIEKNYLMELQKVTYNEMKPLEFILLLLKHISFDHMLQRYIVKQQREYALDEYKEDLLEALRKALGIDTNLLQHDPILIHLLQLPVGQLQERGKSILRKISPIEIQPCPQLNELKILQPELYYVNKGQIIHQSDCQKIIEAFGTQAMQIYTEVYDRDGLVNQCLEQAKHIGIDLSNFDPSFSHEKQALIFKPQIITEQYVENKIRFFSSIFEIDRFLFPIFSQLMNSGNQCNLIRICNRNIAYFGKALCYFNSEPGKILIFKKKLEKEANIFLDVVVLLLKKGFICEKLRCQTEIIRQVYESEKRLFFIKMLAEYNIQPPISKISEETQSVFNQKQERALKAELYLDSEREPFNNSTIKKSQPINIIMENVLEELSRDEQMNSSSMHQNSIVSQEADESFQQKGDEMSGFARVLEYVDRVEETTNNKTILIYPQISKISCTLDNSMMSADSDKEDNSFEESEASKIQDNYAAAEEQKETVPKQSEESPQQKNERQINFVKSQIVDQLKMNQVQDMSVINANLCKLDAFIDLFLIPSLNARKQYLKYQEDKLNKFKNELKGKPGAIQLTRSPGIVWCDLTQPKTVKYYLRFKAYSSQQINRSEKLLFQDIKQQVFHGIAKSFFEKRCNRECFQVLYENKKVNQETHFDVICINFEREGVLSERDIELLQQLEIKIEAAKFRIIRESVNPKKFKRNSIIDDLTLNAQRILGKEFAINDKFIQLQKKLSHDNDQCVFPKQLVSHLEIGQKSSENSHLILLFLIAALTKSISPQSDYIKEELSRLNFVGDSAINQAVVLHLSLAEDIANMEKQLDFSKISSIKTSNVSQKCHQAGLDFLVLSDSQESAADNQPRSLDDVFQSIMGFFSIYIGLDVAQLFMYDLKIIQDYPGELSKKDGSLKNKDFKFAILQSLSKFHKNQFTKNFYKKFVTYLFYKNIEQFSNLHKVKEVNDDKLISFSSGDMHQIQAARLLYNVTTDLMEDSEEYNTALAYETKLRYTGPDLNDAMGYKFRSRRHMLESMTHKSVAEKMTNLIKDKKIGLEQSDFMEIFNEMIQDATFQKDVDQVQRYILKLGDQDFVQKMKANVLKVLNTFDYQRNEYLGDSLLNFSAAKLFYLDTIEKNQLWQDEYKSSSKLHDLKTFFTSNVWLAFLICEHYFFSLNKQHRQQIIKTLETPNKDVQDNYQYLPLIPILNNDQNQQYETQVRKFQAIVFSMISENYSTVMDKMKMSYDISFKYGFTLQRFQNNSQEDTEEFDLDLISGHFVKILSDVHEALIGSIFADSASLVTTDQCISKLISSRYVFNFPLKENPRTRVLNILNSKSYCQNIKVTHSIEDKKDDVYIKVYLQSIEARRMKFKKEQKKKINKSYSDFQKFMEETYFQFEIQHQEWNVENFIEFVRGFRKVFNTKIYSKDPQIINILADYILQKYPAVEKEFKEINHKQLTTEEAKYVRKHLIDCFKEIKIKQWEYASYNKNILKERVNVLQLMELERVRYLSIRQTLQKAGITQIYSRSEDKSFESWVAELTNHQAYNLYLNLKRLAKAKKQIRDQGHDSGVNASQGKGGAGKAPE